MGKSYAVQEFDLKCLMDQEIENQEQVTKKLLHLAQCEKNAVLIHGLRDHIVQNMEWLYRIWRKNSAGQIWRISCDKRAKLRTQMHISDPVKIEEKYVSKTEKDFTLQRKN